MVDGKPLRDTYTPYSLAVPGGVGVAARPVGVESDTEHRAVFNPVPEHVVDALGLCQALPVVLAVSLLLL